MITNGGEPRLSNRGGCAFVRLIGKDGSVKRSASKPVAMQALYALIDTMPMRRAEARER